MTIKLQRASKRSGGVSPSRQGKTWSKYRCLCGAAHATQCLCTDMERQSKRVYFKDLEARHLNGLFNSLSPDRIIAPLGREYQRGIFRD